MANRPSFFPAQGKRKKGRGPATRRKMNAYRDRLERQKELDR